MPDTKNTMNYILEQTKALLAIPSPSGYTKEVTAYLVKELEKYGYEPQITVKGGVVVKLCGSGEDQNALLFTGHIDTLGAMVAEIKTNGRLRITPIGGLDANNAEAENCTVYTRSGKSYVGTFQMNDPSIHVNKEYKTQLRTFESMEVVLDEKVASPEDTIALDIEVGDYVCFEPRTIITDSGFIKSRFLDDKLSAAIMLGYAKQLSEATEKPKRTVYIHFTVYEEVGHGGAASIPQGVTEMLAVDMGCVGEGLICTEHMVSICVKDSRGPSDYDMVSKLITISKEHNLQYAPDVYPFYASDVDVALLAGNDLKHALIGPGVYASHGYERAHVDGVENTLALIQEYVKL